MVIEVTLDTVLIFLVFVVVVFILYKTFKLIVKASLIVFAAFSFPWVAQYIGLPITPSIETGLMFAVGGFGLFALYEFFNFIAQLFRILMWPFKKKK
ncbi:MAG: hypothetical protein QXK49_03775 [Candidatus Aenigmatarchaeota archaeon]